MYICDVCGMQWRDKEEAREFWLEEARAADSHPHRQSFGDLHEYLESENPCCPHSRLRPPKPVTTYVGQRDWKDEREQTRRFGRWKRARRREAGEL